MRLDSHTASRSTIRNRFAALPLCAALAAAAVLGACSSSSAWRSSSAMTGDRAGGKVAAAPASEAGTAVQEHPAPSPVAEAQPSSAGGAASDAAQQQASSPQPPAASPEGDGGQTAPAPAASESEGGTAASHATELSTASSQATDAAGLGTVTDTTADHDEAAGTGNVAAPSENPGAEGASGGEALAAADATHDDARQADANPSAAQVETPGSDSSGAGAAADAGTEAAAGAAASAGAAEVDAAVAAAAAAEDATHGAGNAGQTAEGASGTTATGAAGETASGTAGANLDHAADAAMTASAAGASDGGNTLSPEHAAQQGGGRVQPDEIIIGMVEAPGKKATPTETVIPQTLGGMLPLTLGVEGEGEFDFDKAVLREQVRVVLDELVRKLKSADYDRLEIVGHTDRIGTEDYNQYLSERRAWAVARYLIEQGVPATKVRVEGRGMHEPLTAAGACDGLPREEAIGCLQKDRRVVISASIRRVDVNVQ